MGVVAKTVEPAKPIEILKPQDITDSTVILSLDLGKVTNRRTIESNTDAVETEIDRKMLHVGIDLFDAPELRACQTFQTRLKAEIRTYCVPSFMKGGMYMVKLEAIEIVDKLLHDSIEQFKPVVQAFADAVEKRKAEARERLKGGFDDSLYPTPEQVLAAYRIEWRWWSVGTPDSLKKISIEFFNREKQKAADQLQAATDGITAMLASEAKKLSDHLIERLTPGEDGKPKQIRQSVVSNISNYLSTFSLRNIGTSEELNAQITRIQSLVEGVDAKDLKMNESLRADVQKNFKEVAKALDALVVNKPKRFMAGA